MSLMRQASPCSSHSGRQTAGPSASSSSDKMRTLGSRERRCPDGVRRAWTTTSADRGAQTARSYSAAQRHQRHRRVAASGGDPSQVTTLDGGRWRNPASVAEAAARRQAFPISSRTGAKPTGADHLGWVARRRVARQDPRSSTSWRNSPSPDYLLFVRDGALMAQRFDAATFQLSGEPALISDRYRGIEGSGRVGVSASRTGSWCYVPGAGDQRSRH